MCGSFWSITKYHYIVDVESRHQEYSSEAALGGLMINRTAGGIPNSIAMDPPKHTSQRRIVAPTFTPTNVQAMAAGIRERAHRIIGSLPRNEMFDWVHLVSIEVITQMLTTLFDFPFEERRRLTFGSDVSVMDVQRRCCRFRRKASGHPDRVPGGIEKGEIHDVYERLQVQSET